MTVNEQTSNAVSEALKAVVRQELPKVSSAVHETGKAGSLSIKIDLKPDKELLSRVGLVITPKLALPGIGGLFRGKTQKVGGVVQLSLLSALEDEEAA